MVYKTQEDTDEILNEEIEKEILMTPSESVFYRLLRILGFLPSDFSVHFSLKSDRTDIFGRPVFYSLDFAIPEAKIFFEIDGREHRESGNKVLDSEKNVFLVRNGWAGLRIDNRHITDFFQNCKEQVLEWMDENGVLIYANGKPYYGHSKKQCPYMIHIVDRRILTSR